MKRYITIEMDCFVAFGLLAMTHEVTNASHSSQKEYGVIASLAP